MRHFPAVVIVVATCVHACSSEPPPTLPPLDSGSAPARSDAAAGARETGLPDRDAAEAEVADDVGAADAAPSRPEAGQAPQDGAVAVPHDAARGDASAADSSPSRDADADGPSGASLGCGTNTAAPSASVQQTMQVGGKTRYYLLYVPSRYSSATPMPLIFTMHGRGGNNVWAAAPPDKSDWFGRFALKEASAGQAIIVYPQGSGDPPGNTASFSGTSGWSDEDLPFYDALFAHITSRYCINTKRVFAAGYSMGGMFSNTLACQRAGEIRAVAPVAGWGPGSSPTGTSNNCPTATGKIADMHTHGTKDATIPFTTGRASAEFWRNANGCGSQPAVSSPYQNCDSFPGCPRGREVYFCSHSGDHQVPSFAGANIWKFFSSLPDL